MHFQSIKIKDLSNLPIPVPDDDYPVIQYADDTIVIMPADVTQAMRMKQIMQDYAVSVGLRFNFQKSTLIPVNTSGEHASMLAGVFGCSTGSMPFTYLGLPMGTSRPSVLDLMPLVTSVERRLSTAASLLDYGSKLTLVNSVITWLSMPCAQSKYHLKSLNTLINCVDTACGLRRPMMVSRPTTPWQPGN